MSERFLVRPEAEEDLTDAYVWYERCSSGMGKEFLRCVNAAFAAIKRAPEAYSISFDEFRHLRVRRFPYIAFYEIQEDYVVVYGVMHAHRDPDGLKQSLDLRKPSD